MFLQLKLQCYPTPSGLVIFRTLKTQSYWVSSSSSRPSPEFSGQSLGRPLTAEKSRNSRHVPYNESLLKNVIVLKNCSMKQNSKIDLIFPYRVFGKWNLSYTCGSIRIGIRAVITLKCFILIFIMEKSSLCCLPMSIIYMEYELPKNAFSWKSFQ